VLTLFAMVLAIGIVVDDAIVVIENVERIMSEEGLPPRDATRKAMGQIFGAIIAITVVLTAVFVPMAFFGGSVGAIYRQFAVTLVLTMGFSALLALTLTPGPVRHAAQAQAGSDDLMPTTGFFGWFNRGFAAHREALHRATRRMLGKPGRWLVVYAAILGATGWLFTKLPGSFLPDEDQGYFLSIVQLPAGATRERTWKCCRKSRHYLASRRKSPTSSASRLLLLRPRPERRDHLRPPQGLGRAHGQGPAPNPWCSAPTWPFSASSRR
jgi:multidrug efflux pump subunit AcrB